MSHLIKLLYFTLLYCTLLYIVLYGTVLCSLAPPVLFTSTWQDRTSTSTVQYDYRNERKGTNSLAPPVLFTQINRKMTKKCRIGLNYMNG